MAATNNTPYDDTFRILMTRFNRFVIPFVNEMFDEDYSEEATVKSYHNEHFTKIKNGKKKKRITDSFFEIFDKSHDSKKQDTDLEHQNHLYHVECQSDTDGTIVVRVFEYEIQIAIENAVVEEGHMIVKIPNSGILILRTTDTTPRKIKVTIQTPGTDAEYHVQTIMLKDYDLDEIFEKKLFFLLPFYMFNEETKFEEINNDDNKIKEFKVLMKTIKKRLDHLEKIGTISTHEKRSLLSLMMDVTEKLLTNYENIKEGVKEVMDLPRFTDFDNQWNKAVNNGRKEGIKEGIKKGEKEGLLKGEQKEFISTVFKMKNKEMTPDGIADLLDKDLKSIETIFDIIDTNNLDYSEKNINFIYKKIA